MSFFYSVFKLFLKPSESHYLLHDKMYNQSTLLAEVIRITLVKETYLVKGAFYGASSGTERSDVGGEFFFVILSFETFIFLLRQESKSWKNSQRRLRPEDY
jgi:hypothetical protein